MVRKQSNAKKKKNSKSVFKKDNTILQNSFQNELSSFLDMENSENVGSIIKDEPVLKNINSTKSILGSNLKTLSQTTIESVTSSYTSKLNDYDGHLVQMVKDFGNLRNNQEIQLKALSDINFTIKNCPSFIQRQITRQKLYAFGMLGALALHAESIESWQNIKEEIEIFLSSEKKDANLTSSPNREDNRIPIDIFEKLMNRFSNETEFKLMIDYLEYLSECKDVLKHVKKNQNEVLLLNKEVQTEEISMFQKQPDIKKKRTNLKIFNDIPEETMKKQEGSSSEEDENNGIESLTILSQKTNEEEKEGILKKWATATDLPSVNSTFIPCNQDPERFTDSDVLSPSASTIAFLSDEEEWRVLKDQPDTPDLGSSTNSTSQTTEPTQIENVEMVLSLTSVLTSSFHSQSTNFEMKTEKESLIAPPLPPLSVGSQGSSVDPAGIAPMSSSAPPPPALLIGSQRSSVEPSGIAPMSSSAPPPPPLPIGSQGSSVEPSGIAPMSRSAPPPPPLPVGKQGSSVDVSGIAPMSRSAPPPPPLPVGKQGSSVDVSGIAPMSRSAPPPPPLPIGSQGSSVDVSGIAPMSRSAPPPPPLPVGKQGSSVDVSGIAPMSSSAPPPPPLPIGSQGSSVEPSGIAPMSRSAPPPPPLPVGKQGSSVDVSGIAPMSSSAPPPPPPLPVGKQGSSVDPTRIAPMSSSAPPPPPPLPVGKQGSSVDTSGIAPMSSLAPPPPPPPLSVGKQGSSVDTSGIAPMSSLAPPPPPPPLSVGKQGSSVDTSGIAPMSSLAPPPPPPPLSVGKQGSFVDPTGIAPMSSSAPPPPPPLPFGKQKSSADPSGIAPLSSSAPPPPPTVPKTTSLSSSFPKGNSSTLPPPPPPPLPPWSQFAKPSTDWQSRNEFGTETTISPSLSPGIVKAAIVYKKEKKTVLARWQKLSPMQMQGAVTVFNDSFCVDFNEEERKKMEEIFEEAPIKQPLKRIGGSVGRNFGAKITARAAISSTDISSSNSKSPTNAQLLCSSKALTLEIVLKKLRPLTFTDLITKLETNETNDIKVDLMTTLHANYPDADELAIFENVEFKDLSHASDQFCWHISRKKTLKLRIELLITKENVTAEINKFQQQVEQMMTACNLARSDIIQTLLRKCLQYGNYLNQGSMFAEAAGFSLSYLTALLQLKGKGSNSSIRLVDLLVSFCDLSTLEIEEIQQKMSDVRSLVLKDLESAVDQAEKTVKKLNNAMKKTEDQSLILSYESFMKKTMEKLENVRNGVQELRTREVELRAYLCAKDMNLQNIFEIIENAMRIVRDAIKQLAEKARVQRTTSMVVLPSSSISQRSLREGEMTLSRRSLALKSRDLPVEELKKLFSHQSFGHQRVKKTSPLATSNEDGSSVSSRQQNIRSRTREMKENEIQQMNEISSSIGSPV